MSNKPKIHAFCNAGCKWETVHMDDFLKSATFYEVGQPDGVATVDAYRKYRIFSDSDTNTGKYTATIEFQSPDATGETYATQNTFTVSTGYRKYFDFEVLQAQYNGAMLRIVYEVNGEADVLNINLETTEHDLTKSVLKITGASQVLIYNDTAEILGNVEVTSDNEGSGNTSTARHAVVVSVIDGVASRSAQEIFDLLQYGCVVVALVNGNYCYQYKRVILADSGVIDRCEFSYTDVSETQDTVTTFCISIDNNKIATDYQYDLSSDGSSGAGGTGTSVVVGDDKPASACLWFNTSGDTSGDEVEPDPVKYSVTYNLTNCESRDGTNCEVVEGSEYQDTITAKEGYELKSVTVTMGGSAVTVTDGAFYIASVTGDIVITATARVDNTPTYTVTVDNTHGGIVFVQGRPTEVEEGGTLYSQIAAQSGGNFSIHITMGGVDITDTAYTDDSSGSSANSNYGTIRVNNVNGDIVITIRPV